MITIDSDVPAPSTKPQGLRNLERVLGSDYKLPFENLNVSDSFLIPKDKYGHRCILNAVASSARTYGRQTNKKFKTHTMYDGIRCWRIL